MQTKNIFEICNPKQWKTLSTNDLYESGYPVYGAGGVIGYWKNYNHEKETLIIGCRGSCGNLIITERQSYINGNAMALDDLNTSLVDIKYLYYYLSYRGLDDTVTGGVQKQITRTSLKNVFVTIPSLETQKKIVEVLDKAQGLIDARKEQIRLMDELIQSVFYEMFGERKIYPIRNMNDICIKITDGTHQSPQFVEQGIPFLFVSNIVNGKIIYNTSKFISRKEYDSLIKRTPIENGDILYTIVGSYGNPAIVKSDKEFCFQRHIAYLKPNKEIVDSEYLATAMVMPDFKYQLEKKVKGIAQKTLNLSELKTMQVVLPPISTQYLFRDKVEGINKTKEILNDSLLMLEISIKSLMSSAFKGELFGGL